MTDPKTGRKTLQLFFCRKCRQPYLFGYFLDGFLKALGSHVEDRGIPLFLAWDLPQERLPEEDAEASEIAASNNSPPHLVHPMWARWKAARQNL